MKIQDCMINIVPHLSGTVLGIGIYDETIIEKINANKKIDNFDIINQTRKEKGKEKIRKQKKLKKVSIKKLHKVYKKKSITNILCSSKEIEGSIRFFVRESIRLGTDCIYFFGELEKYKIDDIIKKYKRYPVKIEEKREENNFFITIHIGSSKYHFFKDKWYMIVDGFFNIIDLVGDGLLG